jgi:hypothetical protein
MLPSLQLRQAHPAVRVLLSLLLVISFLYNPYVRAQANSGELNLRHPFSNRATVGASELEKYASTASETGHAVIAVCFLLAIWAAVGPSVRFVVPGANEQIQPQATLSGNVWFRPPPAL